MDLQTFEPTYQLSERGAQVVSRLKTLVSQSRILCAAGAALEVHRRSPLSLRIGALQILPALVGIRLDGLLVTSSARMKPFD